MNETTQGRIKAILAILTVVLCLSAIFGPTLYRIWKRYSTRSVTLAWDPPPKTEQRGMFYFETAPIKGYRIFVYRLMGTNQIVVSRRTVDVGLVTNAVIPNLIPGELYAFTASSIGVDDVISDPSGVLLFRVPREPKTPIKFWASPSIDTNAVSTNTVHAEI